MIWLSNSAQRYALDVCDEISNYRAIVYVRRITLADGSFFICKLLLTITRTYVKMWVLNDC